MNLLLKISQRVANENIFVFNVGKCAYIAQRETIILLGNEKIQKVDSFCYLRIKFNFKGIDVKKQFIKVKEKLTKTIQFFVFFGNE